MLTGGAEAFMILHQWYYATHSDLLSCRQLDENIYAVIGRLLGTQNRENVLCLVLIVYCICKQHQDHKFCLHEL